jgi:hypothetical protein
MDSRGYTTIARHGLRSERAVPFDFEPAPRACLAIIGPYSRRPNQPPQGGRSDDEPNVTPPVYTFFAG